MRLRPLATDGLTYRFVRSVRDRLDSPGLDRLRQKHDLPLARDAFGNEYERTVEVLRSGHAGSPAPIRISYEAIRHLSSPAATEQSVNRLLDRLLTRESFMRHVPKSLIDAHAELVEGGAAKPLSEYRLRALAVEMGINDAHTRSQRTRWRAAFPPKDLGQRRIGDPGLVDTELLHDTAIVESVATYFMRRAGVVFSRSEFRDLPPEARAALQADSSFDLDALDLGEIRRDTNFVDQLRGMEGGWEREIHALEARGVGAIDPNPSTPIALSGDAFWDSAIARVDAMLLDRDPDAQVSPDDLKAIFGGPTS